MPFRRVTPEIHKTHTLLACVVVEVEGGKENSTCDPPRINWYTPQELLEDGAWTNPYSTWEYCMALQLNGKYDDAQTIHPLAANHFEIIGDRA